MEKPDYSSNFLGVMMDNCWKSDPKERPTFPQIAETTREYIETLASFDHFNQIETLNGLNKIVDHTDSTPNELFENC